jgi:hypothetical protein
MREPVTAAKLDRFMRALGSAATEACVVFLVGGSSALLHGWRDTTVDVNLKLIPEVDSIYRAIPHLKDELSINVELASPGDFLPELPGWRERSPFIARHGHVAFHHYDFYAQALAKLERGHARDLGDVAAMRERRLIEDRLLLDLLAQIEPGLYRFPSIDPPSFRRAVEAFVASAT